MSIRMILCEGYYDRAFWAGYLEYRRGCIDARRAPGRSISTPVEYPWGGEVKGGGAFGYQTRAGELVVVRPVEGNSRLLKEAENLLVRADQKSARIDWMVISADADLFDDGSTSEGYVLTQEKLADFLLRRKFDHTRDASGVYVLKPGTKLCLLSWTAADGPTLSVPSQQTLERLVCCALCAAYPARAQAVQTWLDNRPDPAPLGVKEFAWSQMAGWHAKHGCQDFYKDVWRDERVAEEFEARLQSGGMWDVVQQLAG